MQTKEMNRTAIIQELSKHAHPNWYHSLLNWKTENLRKLLGYYRGELVRVRRIKIQSLRTLTLKINI